ncbi:MAG: hypothetical protein IKY44_02200, partial [Clostridia bacterium]|nr:hypothetical protein [Clostridia bacterium]
TEKRIGRIVMSIFTILTIALVAVRTVISRNYIEAETGFYIGNYDTIVLIFNVVLVLFTIAMVVFPLMRFKNQRFNARPDGKVMGFVSLILAAGFIYDVYANMTIFSTSKACHHFISLFTSARTETTNIVVDIFQGYMLLASVLFALLSLIYFVIVAFSCFGTVGDYSRRSLLSLSPIWWAVFRAVYVILVPMRFTTISDMLYEAIMIGFLLLFFTAFARIASRVDGENSVGKAIAYGLCAAIYAAISSVPRIISRFSGIEGTVYTSPQDAGEIIFKSDYCFMNLAILIFCAGFAMYALRRISTGRAYLESTKEEIDLFELEESESAQADE